MRGQRDLEALSTALAEAVGRIVRRIAQTDLRDAPQSNHPASASWRNGVPYAVFPPISLIAVKSLGRSNAPAVIRPISISSRLYVCAIRFFGTSP